VSLFMHVDLFLGGGENDSIPCGSVGGGARRRRMPTSSFYFFRFFGRVGNSLGARSIKALVCEHAGR
jgi:hypothetical protein